ncbi:MAG: TetR/AcrR family transcriptional regulator [Chloroflexota bacterium]|nr:TetR/AcrR family transcriptional regulator [Chloroflexota bacterium]
MKSEKLNRGERTREQIIQAAHDLFVQQGYHGTSMRQIANHASISLGGLYNHFDSKEEVFKAVFVDYHPYHRVLPILLAVQGESVETRVRHAAFQMRQAIEDDPDFMNLMFIEVVEFKSAHASKVFEVVLPQGIEVVERIVGDQQDETREIPALMLIRSFLGLLFSYFLTEIIFAASAPSEFRENAMDYLVDIYLHGILEVETK